MLAGSTGELVGLRAAREAVGEEFSISVQAHVLNVLQDIRERRNLSLIFVSHDLAVVKVVSDRIAVMNRGRIVEIGDADAVYDRPAHPYTRRLLDAVPVVDESERRSVASDQQLPVVDDWQSADRALVEVGPGHFAALGEIVHDGEAVP